MGFPEAVERVEVLAIGHELLDGRVADTNSVRLGKELRTLGLRLSRRTTIPDGIKLIVDAAQEICSRGSQLCVVSGGLGPTTDDMTAEAFAQLAGVDMVRDEATARKIQERFERRGFVMTDNQLKQADRPAGAILIENEVGTAAGFAIDFEGCRFVCVPGVPSEFDAMVAEAVIKPLAGTVPARKRQHFRTFGLIEGDVDHRLSSLSKDFPAIEVGYRANFPEIHVTLGAVTGDETQLEGAAGRVREALGSHIFAEDEVTLPQTVLSLLTEAGSTLATAESCTGGLIGHLLTDIPGSSAAVVGGVIAYENRIKVDALDVDEDLLAEHGAVSEEVVAAMAMGVRDRFGTTYGLATSGIAGPGGGTDEKPVGTIFLAVSSQEKTSVRRLSLPFSRRRNKMVTAYAALDHLRRFIAQS